jgi:hypothetical protein
MGGCEGKVEGWGGVRTSIGGGGTAMDTGGGDRN